VEGEPLRFLFIIPLKDPDRLPIVQLILRQLKASHSLTCTDVYVLTVSLTRKWVATGVSNIENDGSAKLVIATGDGYSSINSFSQHSAKSPLTFNFKTGDATSAPLNPDKVTHGTLMALSWGFLLPLGVILARFLRHAPKVHVPGLDAGPAPFWFVAHRIIQTTGLIIALAGWIIGLTKIFSTSQPTHLGLGCAIMTIGLLQPINAMFRPHPPDNRTAKRLCWEFVHKWLGRSACIMAVIQIFIGFAAIGADKTAPLFKLYLANLIILGIVFVLLEIRLHSGKAPEPNPVSIQRDYDNKVKESCWPCVFLFAGGGNPEPHH